MSPSLFRLIDRGWKAEFKAANDLKADELLIIAPFIKERVVRSLTGGKKAIRVLTRFSLGDFAEGVSDIGALHHLLETGAEVRGIRNLHAKLYVFGNQRAMVTSANLTEAALTRNHELGIIVEDHGALEDCRAYFQRLWEKAADQTVLTQETLVNWEAEIAAATSKKQNNHTPFADYGADMGFMPDAPSSTMQPMISTQAFVKFFGKADHRSDIEESILETVEWDESHWSLSYPGTKRPRQVNTGDIMFIGHMVHSPDDTRIYGRAIGYSHVPGRDDASAADKKRRDWKEKWSTYIRVREPEFIDGSLANGISLNEMMEELGAEAFAATHENQLQGDGNTNPRTSLVRKAQMRLTPKAAEWLNSKFYKALAEHGRIPRTRLEKLYWPELPQE